MKNVNFKNLLFTIISCLVLAAFATGCKKEGANPTHGDPVHFVDPQFVGKWMWTQGSDGAYYDDNGTYHGPAYGLATQYNIEENGYGTCFNHMFSTLGAGTYLEVNISYNGFFESDNQGHLGFFPISGTYKSTSGEDRALRPDELWNTQSNSGVSFLYQNVTFTTQDGRACFQTTASNGVVDTYFKVN